MLDNTTDGVKSDFISFYQSKNFNFTPNFDGEFHRFDRDGIKNGWYVAHQFDREYFVVSFGDWKTGEVHTFKPTGISEDRSQEFKRLEQRARETEAKQREDRGVFAAEEANKQWQKARESGASSQYLAKKGLQYSYGARIDHDGVLLIPTIIGDWISGLQKIWPDGTKRFISGQALKGASFCIGSRRGRRKILCEGFATAASLHEATTLPVVVAFSAGNMREIAHQLIGQDIIVCADNDQWTKGNPGIEAAKACARILNAPMIAPTFKTTDTKPTDFNDLFLLEGIDAVREQLKEVMAARKRPNEKMTLVQQFEAIAKAISREGPQGLPEFPVKLHIAEHVRGEPIIYEEIDGRVLQRRSINFVAQQIHNYVVRTTPKGKFEFTAVKAKNCADFWFNTAHRFIDEILPVAQASAQGFTFHRLPWDFIEGESPTWDEMFSRMQNAEAGMAWIGSLFVPSDRQQYWWIYGDGGNGKGALNRFLHNIFNGAYRAETAPTKNDKFWTSSLLNARIVVFGDCNNYNFPASGLFKSITGADPIKVEPKGEQAFSAKLVCKLLFLSNERPNIASRASDTRRAIFSEIAPIQGKPLSTDEYDQLLWNEGAAFLYKCVEKYKSLCPSGGIVPVDATIIDDLADDNEDFFRGIFDECFEVEGPEPSPLDQKIERDKWWVHPGRLHIRLKQAGLDDGKRRNFIDFMRRKCLILKKRIKLENDELENRYVGIREKPNDFVKVHRNW